MRQIALVPDVPAISSIQPEVEAGSSESICKASEQTTDIPSEEFECDCDMNEDRLALLDAILGYFDSPVSWK